MNNRYGDNRYGDDRWQDRNRQAGRYEESSRYGSDRGGDDRGFFERAGDEVRSWFGDDEAERRRESDDRRWERERGMSSERGHRDQNTAYAGYHGTASGWGNQSGDSWNRDRPGVSSGSGSGDWQRGRSGSSYGSARAGNRDDDDRRYGDTSIGAGGGGGPEVFGEPYPGGTSGFGGAPDHGRRFDRIDAGSTGTHGVHPMSAPVGGAYGAGYGIGATGEAGSSARYAAYSQGGQQQGQTSGARYAGMAGGAAGGAAMMGGRSGRSDHDPHYSEWRNRQIESLDRDYDEYCREHQSKFDQEFGSWRSRRNEQRQSMSRVTEHMEVVGSDGEKIGTVDAVKDDRIILTRNDENAGGMHHSIPCGWIDRVEDRVHVNKTREEAMREWRDEEQSRALFEREDSGSRGPHVLNRSFSGTYRE